MTWNAAIADRDRLAAAAREFYDRQVARCAEIGIDASAYPISHLAVRVPTWREYVAARDAMEAYATANLENVWNGRPISKILLAEPIQVAEGISVPLIELIPPFHQRVYAMGLEHYGFVVGPDFPVFIERHRDVLTGQQFQSPVCMPVYRLFDDYTHVKFYETGLGDVCILEGARFDGIHHAEWSPTDPDAGPFELGRGEAA
jgi:predicted metalloenzyme YecM